MKRVYNRVHFFLWISSFFKYLALKSSKIPLICDALSIPGWFVMHEHIIHMTVLKNGKLSNGTQWDCYEMPDEWCNTISRAMAKSKKAKNNPKN